MMTEQERTELEQAAKPQRWGSKERVALVAEVLRQRRMVEWLCGCLENRTDKSAETWKALAEHVVAEEISPKG